MVVMAACAWGACSSSEGSDPAVAPDGAATVSRTIGPGGGTLASADGELVVEIPEGALPADVVLTIGVATGAPGTVGQVYEIGPSGTQFAVPVAISFKPPAPGAVADDPMVATEVDGAWQALPYGWLTADAIGGVTTHLSKFALVLPKDCSCGVEESRRCCEQVSGTFSSSTPDDAGRARLCTCTLGGRNRFERHWQHYDCVKSDLSPDLACRRAPAYEECCRSLGGIILVASFDTCLCSKRGTCGLSNDQLPTPIQSPCAPGYRQGRPDGEEDGPDPQEDAGSDPQEDAGSDPQGDAGFDAQPDGDAGCACPTYDEFLQRIDGPKYRGPSCFTAEGNPMPWSGTCRSDCTCTLINEALATWTSADEASRNGVVMWACGWEQASWEELAERAVWSCN